MRIDTRVVAGLPARAAVAAALLAAGALAAFLSASHVSAGVRPRAALSPEGALASSMGASSTQGRFRARWSGRGVLVESGPQGTRIRRSQEAGGGLYDLGRPAGALFGPEPSALYLSLRSKFGPVRFGRALIVVHGPDVAARIPAYARIRPVRSIRGWICGESAADSAVGLFIDLDPQMLGQLRLPNVVEGLSQQPLTGPAPPSALKRVARYLGRAQYRWLRAGRTGPPVQGVEVTYTKLWRRDAMLGESARAQTVAAYFIRPASRLIASVRIAEAFAYADRATRSSIRARSELSVRFSGYGDRASMPKVRLDQCH